jgi:hypothetical protein
MSSDAVQVRRGGRGWRVLPPVCAARSADHLWFPTLTRLPAGGGLLLAAWTLPDGHDDAPPATHFRSDDGGRTWGAAGVPGGGWSEASLLRADGACLLLPFRLYHREDRNVGGPLQWVPPGGALPEPAPREASVAGWPRPVATVGHSAEFYFCGSAVALPNGGGYLTTLHGKFTGDDRYTLVAAHSGDGFDWRVRSVVAAPEPGVAEGPTEGTICLLPDGRLLCVHRRDGTAHPADRPPVLAPYGRAYSADGGHTWTPAPPVPGVRSAQPCLLPLPDGGLVLSGGRPGLSLWFDAAGSGDDWEPFDLTAHHNAHCPSADRISTPDQTTGYTEVVAAEGGALVCVYDRVPFGWARVPAGSPETNSVWVVRLEPAEGEV